MIGSQFEAAVLEDEFRERSCVSGLAGPTLRSEVNRFM